jgi:NifB/MoaA-like Fe-S oxidoreductase
VVGTAVHVNSGEFFLHPQAGQIIDYLMAENKLRSKHFFTNGMGLSKEHIKIMRKTGMELSLTLSSTNINTRKGMMGGSYLDNKMAIDSLEMLDKLGVKYHVVIIPLRSNLNSGDLENTYKVLSKHKLQYIAISRPGYTKLTPAHIAEELALSHEEMWEFLDMVEKKYKIKVLLPYIPKPKMRYEYVTEVLSDLFSSSKDLNRKRKLFLCAESVKDILPKVVKELGIQRYDIKPVESKVFGGNIECAGLLLVEDYIYAVEEYLRNTKKPRPEVMIMPRESFDINMEDISMTHAKKIIDRFKIKVVVVDYSWTHDDKISEKEE